MITLYLDDEKMTQISVIIYILTKLFWDALHWIHFCGSEEWRKTLCAMPITLDGLVLFDSQHKFQKKIAEIYQIEKIYIYKVICGRTSVFFFLVPDCFNFTSPDNIIVHQHMTLSLCGTYYKEIIYIKRRNSIDRSESLVTPI